ncbi:MAG: hypothetical protein OEZ18_00790 [Candidatus Bathyarchaeota archaeon]|nr:hypothetical protein [Candidatus Bathyarchaeota archaeon]
MKIKRKEICFGIILSVLIALSAVYFNMRNEEPYSLGLLSTDLQTELRETWGLSTYSQETQHFKLISETIEGELKRGTFEDVVSRLEILTEEKYGYVKSLLMTYQDQVWSGLMICMLPPTNVTSFTFGARAIIEANGTVTYINISVEDINVTQQSQENTYSTINLNLKEIKPENGVEIGVLLAPVLSVLTTSLSWIAQGVIIGIPLCFASLGIVILVNRGIVPLWKNTLKKTKQPCQT